TRWRRSVLILGMLAVISVPEAARAAADLVSFEESPDGLRIRVDGQPFATYVPERGETTRPFLDHLRTPAGVQVTRNNPPIEGEDLSDHPTFHPGVWLAFGDLNGADSWRNAEAIRRAGDVERHPSGPGQGRLAVRLHHRQGERTIAEE